MLKRENWCKTTTRKFINLIKYEICQLKALCPMKRTSKFLGENIGGEKMGSEKTS